MASPQKDNKKSKESKWMDLFLRIFIWGGIILVVGFEVIPNFLRGRATGNPYFACQSNCKNIGTALEMYPGIIRANILLKFHTWWVPI